MKTRSTIAVPPDTRTGSRTAAMLPLVGCLLRAEEIVGEDPDWQPTNELQRRFLEEVFRTGREDAPKIPEHELRSIASQSLAAINAFLQEQGFDIQLSPASEEPSFALASVLRVAVKWEVPGEERELVTDRGVFPGVLMDDAQVLASDRHPNPIARLRGDSGDVVCMTVADEPLDGLDLLTKIRSLDDLRHGPRFRGVEFPKISCDQLVDVDWLVGLNATAPEGLPWRVDQALQQTRFRMNHLGALSESAAALMMCGAAANAPPPPPRLRIDQPFYLWKLRPDIDGPILAAYFEEDCWQDPGEIPL